MPEKKNKMNEQPWYEAYRSLGKQTANVKDESRHPQTAVEAGKRLAQILEPFAEGEFSAAVKGQIANFRAAVADAERAGRL